MILMLIPFFFFREIFISVPSFFSPCFLFLLQKEFHVFPVLLFEVFLCLFDDIYICVHKNIFFKKIVINLFYIYAKYYKKCFFKNHLNCYKYSVFVFINFLNISLQMYKNRKSEQQNCLKLLKNHLNCFKYNISVFINFSKIFRKYIRMENQATK